MSTVPSRRSRASRTAALLGFGAAATVVTAGAGLLTVGSSLSAAIASAELAAGAMLPAQNVWVLPAVFTVMVFVGVVLAVYLIGGRGGLRMTDGRDSSRTSAPVQTAPIELRAPDRAVAEVRRGLFRPSGY